jgi:hypothetical protein
MTVENTTLNSWVLTSPPAADMFLPFPIGEGSRAPATQGLSGHVRQMSRKNQGISRWLLFAVLGGAVVAFVMIQLTVR